MNKGLAHYGRILQKRECICGLDHTKPTPDIFNDPPIVFSSTDHPEAVCHACGAFGPKGRAFFEDPLLHDRDCKYIKSLGEEVV